MKKILLLALFAGCFGVAHAAPLKVLSATPKGQTDNLGRQAVEVHFNQPVVALGEDTQFDGADCPFTITPHVAGSCRYSGTQTAQFEPAENWPAATRFTVRVPKGFTSQVSGKKMLQPYSFSFTTQVPQVLSVLPYKDEHWIGLTPTLFIQTSLPLDLSRAGEFVALTYPRGKRKGLVPTLLRTPTPEELKKYFDYLSAQEQARIVAIQPTDPLLPGLAYTLTLRAGLPAQMGNAGMAQDYTSTFYTYPALDVYNVVSSGCLPFTPQVQLSTPVRKRELWNHVVTVPAEAKRALTDQEKESVGSEYTNPKTGEAYFTQYLSFINVEPQKPVQVTLTKGMKDIFGNVSDTEVSFTISTSGYCPAVDFSSDGFGVLESYLPARLPISLMNIPAIALETARFNKDNFIPFDRQETSYCAKKPLTQTAFAGDYKFKDVKDKTDKTFIDLSRFHPTATDSIIFSQLKLPREDKDCWVSSTDNITDVGVSFKTSGENILVWATSLKTAEPLAGLAVQLRNKDNQIVWQGTTDQNGLALAPGWNKLNVPAAQWGQPMLYAFVSSEGGDAVVSNLWNNGTEPWRFNISYAYDPSQENPNTFLFTERGIYRPGETVYVKGIMRLAQEGNLTVPTGAKGTLVLHDARGEELWKKNISLSSQWGSFSTSFTLPEDAPSGYWDLSFEPQVKGKTLQASYASFQVDPVKPADFNITLQPDSSEYVGGQEATFSAAAQYYFGSALSGAKAQWTLRRENTWFTPKGYEKYTFTPYFLQRNFAQENGKLLLNASGKLDSRGGLLFAAKMPTTEMPVRVYGEIEIESPARQHLFKRTSVLVHPADIYIGAKTVKETNQAGTPVELDVVAVTPQGAATETTVTAEIYKEEYFSVRKVGLAGRLEWVSERKVTPLPSQTFTVGKKGTVMSFMPQDGGAYYVKFTAKDLFGRTVQGGIDVYVYGESNAYAKQREDDILPLTANKQEYKVGQKARIRVQSPFATTRALVSVEREGILDAWTVTLKGGEGYVEVPIKENYLPNVYVSVLAIEGRTDKPATHEADLGKPQGKIGYVNLNVIADKKRLTTTLKTDGKIYRPGQRAIVNLTTKANGKPVAAEVAVMVVDEGVLALTNYKTPDPFDFFYGSKPLSVFTVDNRAYVIGQRSFGEKGENRGGGGAANSKLAGTDMRSRFEFTPYFQAAVQTDQKGRGTVSFELPDNLTTFRVMAVALTENQFGQGQTSLTVSKPVMITPNLPRFARENDAFACRAIVYNYEDKKGQFTVTASAMGSISLTGETEQTLQIPLGESREVTWPCRATKEGEGVVSFAAKGRYSDGVENRIEVSMPEKEQTLATVGSTVYTQTESVTRPQVLSMEGNRVTLSLASTALLQFKGAISYLLEYPYNCLEQQLSKITPVVMSAQIIRDFKLADLTAARKQAQEVLNRLPQYQNEAGGFAYWPGALPDAYLTAYALDVAHQAKAQGFTVNQTALDKAANWLESAFNKDTLRAYAYSSAETEITRAYSAYVLARYGKNTDSIFNTLFANRATLPQTAIAYLLLEAQETGREESVKQLLTNRLRNTLVTTPATAYIEEKLSSPWVHSNSISATAYTLAAFVADSQQTGNEAKMVTWLLKQLNAKGYWQDTHTSAAVLRALQVYYSVREQAVPDFNAAVTQNYQTRLNSSFRGRSMKEEKAELPFSQVYADGPRTQFTFAKQGTGTLYYTLGQVYHPGVYEIPANAGFHVVRRITALDGSPVSAFQAGSRYKVTLHIQTAAARSFVVAEDYIPAGFEIVSNNLSTESVLQAEQLAQENGPFTRTEPYTDHIYAFADELPAGQHTFSYLVTATSAGSFIYPAAWVSQMYDSAVFGRTATSLLVID